MSNPANLSYSDIETRVMNSMRISTADGTQQARIQAVINEVYRDICAKSDWWWRIKRFSTTTGRTRSAAATVPDGLVGPASVNVTYGSPTITFSDGTLNTIDLTNRKLFIPENADDPGATYPITDWSVPPVGTLASAYTGSTTTSTGYKVFDDFIEAPSDAGKILRMTRWGQTVDMERVGIERMERVKQIDTSEGPPQLWSIYDFATSGDPTQVRMLWVHPYPDKGYRVDVWYQQNLNTELTGSAVPMIPDDFRQVLVYGALARCYPIFLNDLDRGGFYQSLFNDVMALMAAQQKEYASDKPGIQPNMRAYRRTRPRRSSSVVLGSWFDRLPFEP